MTVTASGHGRHTIAAEGFLRALADHGVDYFFCNPGTDFPPIVEAFSRAKKTNAKVPKPVLVPHENLAVAMAHGAYLMNGRPQAVMVHVNVGTGNTINNITNMSRDRVPLILAAGRTPITEQGQFGSRSRPIHWAQEMFDQAGMLRELVKWDYELRQPSQVGDVVARAVEVSMAHPRGPVYLVLPREPLAAPLAEPTGPAHPRPIAVAPHPDPRQIETLADWLSSAERPLIIPGALPADAVEPLSQLAERCAIPVVPHNPRTVCLPSSHHMHFGNEPGALLADADLVIVLDSDVPWIPSLQHPPAGCHVAHVGEDPFYVRYPMRSFPSDLAIQAGVTNTLVALAEAMEQRLETTEARIAARRARLTERMRNRHIQLAKDSAPGDTISPEYLSRVIGETVGPGRGHLQRVSAQARPLPAREARHLFLGQPGRRPGLGLRRRARRQAGGAGQVHCHDPRRRRPHVRQSDRRPLGLGGTSAAGAGDRVQQQPLWRRTQGHALHVQGRRRR